MRENGGSRITLCGEKMQRSRTSLRDDEAAAVGDEEALPPLRRDTVQQCCRVAAGARDGERPLIDVGGEDLHARRPRSLVHVLAQQDRRCENTSSPVAQPGTQTRTVSSAPRPSNSFGITCSASASKASASRKKLVTLISRSRNSAATSCGSWRSRST